MKKNFHPESRVVTVTCLCGNKAEMLSTKDTLSTETCSQCHPFYTGRTKTIRQGGRIARFLDKYGKPPA